LSVAASRLIIFFRAVFLGLTSQATGMSPLRGWTFAILAAPCLRTATPLRAARL
jgi:hypothetical protein